MKFSRFTRGLFWMGLLRGSTRIFTFVRLAILARILSPSQFGLFGIATLLLAFLEILTETGINVFLIQEEGKLEEYLDTAFLVSIIRGALISLIILVFASSIADFFKTPDSISLIYLISLVSLIRGFINPAIVKFQKELEFNKEFLIRIVSVIFDCGVSLLVCLITKSVLGLVWGMIAGATSEMLISHFLISPKPKFVFNQKQLRRIINRGKWITTAGIFQYFFQNGDNLVVGRLLDTQALGFYQNAYRISTIPITEISEVINKITFPLYTKYYQDKNELKIRFRKYFFGLLLVVIPIGIFLSLFTKEVVLVILGSNWLEIVPVLKLLSFFGVIRAMESSLYPLFLALKKQEYVSYLTLVNILGMVVVIFPLTIKYGIYGAGTSAIFGSLISLPLAFYLYKKVIST